jgi:hypothetical protein
VSNTFLFRKSRSGVRDGLAEPYSQTELRELRAAWVDAVARYPAAYLRHRLRTFWQLIGPHRGAIQGIPYIVNRSAYRDNPPLPPIYAPAAQYRFYALAGALRPTWLFAALPYLLSAGVALVLAWVGGRGPGARLALCVSGSALLYAAGFVLLAPGAELRYLTWPIVAGPLALAFALASCVTGARSARSCIRPDPARTRSPSYRP